tara:strand:+ start:8021 stop:8782 length:762 start_codon:yes stop_codon:yes gene_type:complete
MIIARIIVSVLWKFYITIIFSITTLFFYPLIVPLLFSEKLKKHTFPFFVAWSWSMRVFCFYFVVKKMNSPLPNAPYIIVANHISYLDIFLLPSILPKNRFLFLGKSELLRYPLIKTYFKKLHIPVFRQNKLKAAKSLIKSKRELKKGWSLVIFPEGGIPSLNNPKMIKFKEGSFQLAKSSDVPIVPITFINNHKLLNNPSNIKGIARPGLSFVYIHPFISKEEVRRLSQTELANKSFKIIESALIQEYPDLVD